MDADPDEELLTADPDLPLLADEKLLCDAVALLLDETGLFEGVLMVLPVLILLRELTVLLLAGAVLLVTPVLEGILLTVLLRVLLLCVV